MRTPGDAPVQRSDTAAPAEASVFLDFDLAFRRFDLDLVVAGSKTDTQKRGGQEGGQEPAHRSLQIGHSMP